MTTPSRKKHRGRGAIRCVENKNNFRNQDGSMNYNEERKRILLSDMSIYTIARFLMGSQIQIITERDKYEGVLRAFNSQTIGLSKVFAYDNIQNKDVFIIRKVYEVKEIYLKEVLHMKILNVNGKTDSVIVDQEISQRKQISKPNLNEDRAFIPYFDEDESLIHNNDDDGDDLNDTLKGNQNCWYPPEVMLKVNEERFNVKNTFNETMEEYTTPIDKNDPHLKEKMELAERLAKEIESDNNSKRSHLLDENDGENEEIIFSAVLPAPVHTKPEASVNSNMKLNPNAPEFRPRQKPVDDIQLEPAEEVAENCQQIMNIDSIHQQHRMIQLQHVALQQMSMAPQITPQIQTYPAQQMIQNPQWTLQAPNTGPYVIQPYLPPNQVMQHMMPARQMQQDPVQPGSIYYQFSQPFLIPQDHPLSGSLNDNGTHMYSSNIDAANQQIIHTNSLNQMRQPNFIQHIPMIQTTNPISLHQQQQQQPQNPNPQLNYYQHLGQPINSANFSHLIINQPQQQQPLPSQIQNGSGGPTIQGYITNGR